MNIFLSIIVCFFAVYGTFQLIYNIALYLSETDKTKPVFSHYVILVDDKNAEIEGYVRYLSMKIKENEKLFLIKKNCSEETNTLLKLIEKEFDFVIVSELEEYIDYIDSVILE